MVLYNFTLDINCMQGLGCYTKHNFVTEHYDSQLVAILDQERQIRHFQFCLFHNFDANVKVVSGLKGKAYTPRPYPLDWVVKSLIFIVRVDAGFLYTDSYLHDTPRAILPKIQVTGA